MKSLKYTGKVPKAYRDLGRPFEPDEIREVEESIADALLAWGEPFEDAGLIESPEKGSATDGNG